LIKDFSDIFTPEGSWSHARNAVTNSAQGDMGVISNEPSNVLCTKAPYDVIGAIHLEDDEWVIYSTDDVNSEIGLFKEKTCEYTKIVNAACLNFNRGYMITGAFRENFDCTRQVYWDDGYNPSRTLNIDEIPYKKTERIVDGCVQETLTDEIECEKLLLAPIFEVPCIELKRGDNAGTLDNGSYQAAIAYSVNGRRVTDYIALSNVCAVFDHDNDLGSLEVRITGLETDRFEEYELVIIGNVAAQANAKRIGFYSTNQNVVFLDTIAISLPAVPLENIPVLNPAYEKSDRMFEVDDYLVRVGLYERFDFNYQPLANKIKTEWVAVAYKDDYYYNGGQNAGYMRDEQYAFFIRWVYKTGERSFSYHIPGRKANAADISTVGGADVIYPSKNKKWQVYNTASITSTTQQSLQDNGTIIARGKMGYWESTEKYPDRNSERWGELCGKNIRHHKMPDDRIIPRHTDDGKIVIIAPQFSNIAPPLDNNGNVIEDVVGYEILRGSRLGNKTIVGKGLINNMGEYTVPGNNDENEKTLFVNYPFNDLREDDYLTSFFVRGASLLNNSDLGTERVRPFDSYNQKRYFSFHSPELSFYRTFLSAPELKIYGEATGTAKGTFIEPSKHPKNVIISNTAGLISVLLGLGYLDRYLRGNRTYTIPGGNSYGTFTTYLNTLAKNVPFASYIPGLGQYAAFVGKATTTRLESSDYNNLPGALRKFMFIPALITGLSEGADIFLQRMYDMLQPRQHALQHVSHGFYNKFKPAQDGQTRRLIKDSVYAKPHVQQLNSDVTVNNLFRTRTAVLELGRDLENPKTIDTSRYTLNDIDKDTTLYLGERDRLYNPYKNFTDQISTTIASHYCALKIDNENQYGQLSSVVQLPTGCLDKVVVGSVNQRYTSSIVFGGDTYINRYTEKNTMPFFNNWLTTQPDGFAFDYTNYINVPYPKYWMNSEQWDLGDFFQGLGTGLGNWASNLFRRDENDELRESIPGIQTLPSNMHNLDMRRHAGTLFTLGVRHGYMYLFNSGVRDFYVESEINLAYRDHKDRPETRHYDSKDYTDLDSLFDIDIITSGNYYLYDFSLSNNTFPTFKYPHSILQASYYDPTVAEECFSYRPYKIIYSLPNRDGSIKDPWIVFLPNNYREFGSKPSNIKMAGDGSAMILFENDSPARLLPQDTLKLDQGTKLSVGDGELFNNLQENLLRTDDGYEYATCQSAFGAASTPAGIFWISSDQGKIFQYSKGINEISRLNMKWWLSKYLPFQIVQDFPTFNLRDNTVIGAGVTTIYDTTEEIIYFSKKDYKVKKEFAARLIYDKLDKFVLDGVSQVRLTDSKYFDNASWTLSYDIKNNSWMSFHDWHPDFVIPGQQHFLSVKSGKIYKHNSTSESFCNFYGVDYPFEVELFSGTGQMVSTVRSVEYQLETYQYKNNGTDAHHVLDFNFDRAIVYNSEQVSGLLKLNLSPKNNAPEILSYPKTNTSSIDILYSKEENKYRFNQFWDITDDRGEFSSLRRAIWNTSPSGYIRTLNSFNLDYTKNPHQRKKFRHYVNRVLLRRNISGRNHMMLNIATMKLQLSQR
jgi:hypothetical protein